jgi:N-acetylneuraminic acid mutarotase
MFTIKVTLTDQSGLVSNALTGSFRISAFPWVSMTAMPTPRIHAAAVAIGSRFYAMGGEPTASPMIPAPALNTVEVFDASTGTWSTGAPLPVPLEYLSATNVNGKIYVFGGSPGGLSPCDTSLSAYVFDPQSNAWTTLAAPPIPIGGAAVAPIGTSIFVMGGVGSCPGATASAAVNVYDIATNSWSAAASMLGAAVQLGAGVQNGKIEEFGGFGELNGGNGNASPSAAVYDPATNMWTVNPNGFVMDGVFVISDTATALAGGSLYSIGGRTSVGTLESGAREFDPITSSWVGKESLPANASVFGPVADAYNGVVYVFSPIATWVYTPADDLH